MVCVLERKYNFAVGGLWDKCCKYVASVVSEGPGILYVSLFTAKFRHLASSYNLHCPRIHSWATLREHDLLRVNTDIFIYLCKFPKNFWLLTFISYNIGGSCQISETYLWETGWWLTVRSIRNVLLAGDVLTSVLVLVLPRLAWGLAEKARYHNLVTRVSVSSQ